MVSLLPPAHAKKQLRGEAGPRQIDNGKKLALTHNLGGAPGACVSFVSVVGAELSEFGSSASLPGLSRSTRRRIRLPGGAGSTALT